VTSVTGWFNEAVKRREAHKRNVAARVMLRAMTPDVFGARKRIHHIEGAL
jgi:hypothetical protein